MRHDIMTDKYLSNQVSESSEMVREMVGVMLGVMNMMRGGVTVCVVVGVCVVVRVGVMLKAHLIYLM